MRCLLDVPLSDARVRGHYRLAAGEAQRPEPSVWEELAYNVLRQAVVDAANLVRWGVISERGVCLPWPTRTVWQQGYYVRVPVRITNLMGPNCHHELKAFFHGNEAAMLCELIGVTLSPRDLWLKILRHGGLQ